MEFKYIIDERGNFAIFSKLATHATVARGFDTHNKIVGAGFCHLTAPMQSYDDAKVVVLCSGKSISLGVSSREEDGQIITEKINSDGY